MPMGIVSDDDLLKEISNSSTVKSNPKPIISGTIIDINKGRGDGNVAVPDVLRKVIGDTSVTDGRAQAIDLAAQFGISPSSVSAYSNGATSTASYDKTPNKSTIDGAKVRLGGMAQRRLKMALKHITSDKLEATKARELAGIAKDMAAVVKSLEPSTDRPDESNKPQFVIFAPQVNNIDKYERIIAKDNF